MILRDIDDFIKNNKEATLTEIIQNFNYDKSMIISCIDHLLSIGRITEIKNDDLCKGCTSECITCNIFKDTIYKYNYNHNK